MATRKPTARKRTAKKTTKRPTRAAVARRPSRGSSAPEKLAIWLAKHVKRHAERRRHVVRSRKDAAILRATHAGCVKCEGLGTIHTKGKDGKLTGSKPCPAKPTTVKVSKLQVHKAARFGPDKNSGLIGWRCPCGAKEKPKHRDAKTATAAIRTHERKKHGGHPIGAAWYAQLPEQQPATTKTPTKKTEPVTKKTSNSGMTDQQWEKQNKPMHPATAQKKGLCWQCAGNGALYTAFGGEQKTVVCNECTGTGKAAVTAGSS